MKQMQNNKRHRSTLNADIAIYALRVSMVTLTCLSLLYVSPVSVLAQSIPTVTPAPDNSSTAGAIYGAIQGFGTSFIQSMQQSQYAQQAAAMMSSLQPKIIPAKFFPQCRISQASSNFPADACKNISGPGPLQMAESMAALANNYNQFYTQLLSPAQNSPFPAGAQCLEDAKKGVASQMQDKMNSLTATIARIKKQTQLFRDANRQVVEDMRAVKDELDGGSADRTVANASQGTNLRNQFNDPACKEVLSDSMVQGAKGLRAVRGLFDNGGQGGNGLRSTAGNFIRDVPVYQNHLDTQIKRLQADIKSIGIGAWNQQSDGRMTNIRSGGLTQFSAMGEAINIEKQRFNDEFSRIKKEMSEVVGNEFTIPEMDTHFRENVQGFANGAKQFFKKKFVNNCVSGADNSGVSLTPDQILNGLRMVNNEVGTSLSDFKTAMGNILATDAFIEDKMTQIKALEAQYGGTIRVEFVDANARRTLASPFELYKEQIGRCTQFFEQDQTFSTTSGGQGGASLSMKQKVDRAERYLQDAMKLEQDYVNRMIAGIKTRVLECGQGAGTPVSGQCGQETMNPSNAAFCINTASKCAGNIQSCYQKVDNIVKQKEATLKAKASLYNKNIRGLIAGQEQILSNIKGQVVRDQEFLKRFFPGAEYEFPKDLFVQMPKLEDSPFGVQLVGGKDLDLNFLMEKLPEQLEKLKESLKAQKGNVDREISSYITAQKAAMTENKAKWAALKTECTAAATAFRTQVAAANAAGAKQQAETDGKVGEFCQKYESLRRSNPMAGCEGSSSPSSLQGEAARIAAQLDASVTANIDEYRNLCAQYNNERTQGTSGTGSGSGTAYPLKQFCSGGSWTNAHDRLTTQVLQNMPAQYASKRESIQSFVRTGSPSLSSLEVTGSTATALTELQGLRARTGHYTPSGHRSTTVTPSDARLGSARTELDNVTSSLNGLPALTAANPAQQTSVRNCLRSGTAGSVTTSSGWTGINTALGLTMPAETKDLKSFLVSVSTNLRTRLNDLNSGNLGERVRAVDTNTQAMRTAIDSARSCIASISPTSAGVTAYLTALNSASTQLGATRTSTSALASALPATTPARDTASTHRSSDEVTDICQILTEATADAVRDRCSDESESAERRRCEERAETRYNTSPPNSPSVLAEVNRSISSVMDTARTTQSGLTAQQWQRVGERSSGTCSSAANAARNNGGTFSDMLRAFDTRTMGTGGAIR